MQTLRSSSNRNSNSSRNLSQPSRTLLQLLKVLNHRPMRMALHLHNHSRTCWRASACACLRQEAFRQHSVLSRSSSNHKLHPSQRQHLSQTLTVLHLQLGAHSPTCSHGWASVCLHERKFHPSWALLLHPRSRRRVPVPVPEHDLAPLKICSQSVSTSVYRSRRWDRRLTLRLVSRNLNNPRRSNRRMRGYTLPRSASTSCSVAPAVLVPLLQLRTPLLTMAPLPRLAQGQSLTSAQASALASAVPVVPHPDPVRSRVVSGCVRIRRAEHCVSASRRASAHSACAATR